MPPFAVKQPNGRYAVYDTVIDDLYCLDCTAEEAIEVQLHIMHQGCDYPGGKPGLRADLEREFNNIEQTGKAWPWAKTWRECLWWCIFYYGVEDDAIQEALELDLATPEEIAVMAEEARRENERLDAEEEEEEVV